MPDSIVIENVSQGGKTTLYAPDTLLQLDYLTSIGIGHSIIQDFRLMQNKPNPFSGETQISIIMPKAGNLQINILNLLGQKVVSFHNLFPAGTHTFVFFSGKKGYYILSATADGTTRAIKMVSFDRNSSETGKLVYLGRTQTEYKSAAEISDFIFSLGDQLKFTSYARLSANIIGSDTLEDAPLESKSYLFNIKPYDPCGGEPILTDMNGNVYNTLVIGFQCWMEENLKATNYRNGTPIPNITSSNAWSNLTTGAFAWNNNDISWKDPYGALYNWYAVIDTSGLCPAGWHVPAFDDWTVLAGFLGNTGLSFGNKLKSCRQVNSPLGGECNTSVHPRWEQNLTQFGTNDYEFSGLPGGYRSLTGTFGTVGYTGAWWIASKESSTFGWSYNLDYGSDSVNISALDIRNGFSVRCIRNDTNNFQPAMFPSNPSPGDASFDIDVDTVLTWSCSNPGGGALSYTVRFGTISEPPVFVTNFADTSYQPGTLEYNTTYYWKIVAHNMTGDSTVGPVWSFTTESQVQSCPGIPTITDIDGNEYNTVLIGSQCWFKENLKTTTYQNGTVVPNVTDNSAWAGLTTGAYAWYENDTIWKNLYGALYNWYAMNDTNGLCPAGWHVPGHDEWYVLTFFIGGIDEPHGNELKSCRQVNSPLGGDCNTSEHPRWSEFALQYGTDNYGFSGLPGGYRAFNGTFGGIGDYGTWWSSTEASSGYAWDRLLRYFAGYISEQSDLKAYGYSVRCVKD